MLDQEYDPYLDDEWLTDNDWLTRFSKAREKIVGKVKGTEPPSVQGTQYSEEVLVLREMVPIRTERISLREPVTGGNHAPIGKSHKVYSSANSQEIPVSMENVRPERTEYQYVTSPSG